MEQTKIRHAIPLIFIVIFTMFVIKVMVGADIDETYCVALGARFVQGDLMLKDMWEVHQTSAIWCAILMFVFRTVTGGYTGVVVFLRIATIVLKFIIAYISYVRLRKYFKNAWIAATMFLIMTPKGIFNLDFSHVAFICFYMVEVNLLVLFCESEEDNRIDNRQIFLSISTGLWLSIGVMSYPTMIVVALAVAVSCCFMLKNNKKMQNTILFSIFITCLICFTIFICYLLSYMTPNEIVSNVTDLLSGNESHWGNGFVKVLSKFILDKDKLFQGILIFVVSYGVSLLARKLFKINIPIVYYVLLVSSIVLILLNVTGFRPSGILGLNVRYIIIYICMLEIVSIKRNDKVFWSFYFISLSGLLGATMGTDLSIAESCSYMLTALIGLILASDMHNDDSQNRKVIYGCIGAFVISLIFINSYIVRVSRTSPANILEIREQITAGPLKGVFVYPEYKEGYIRRTEEIQNYVKNNDNVLVVSRDSIYCIMLPSRFTTSCLMMPATYNTIWWDYYSERELPTLVLVDKYYYPDYEEFISTGLGKLLSSNIFEFYDDSEGFWVIRNIE